MKKTLLIMMALATFMVAQAQWVNNPVNNTFIANTSADAGEVYLSTDPTTGNTYVQWSQFATNGWVPKLQCLNFAGEPQWDAAGINPSAQYTLASWSQGFSMVATSDGGVVSCFSTEAGNSVAVKLNADGTYAWGEAGVVLFNGLGGSRTELLAGDDGGVWALATDITNTYLCYIYPNGTSQTNITISDNGGQNCTFGLMVPAPNGNVFVVYEKEQWAYTYFYEKDVRVVGYSKDGTQISDDIQLMSPVTIGGSYIHFVVPDGLGGGYVYIWHPAGMGGTFNTYVFHFNQNGASTITEPTGVPVHSLDPDNFYLDAHADVDPITHELIIAYRQTDEYSQSQSRIYANRFDMYGTPLWDEGKLVADWEGSHYSDILVSTYEYEDRFCIIYNKGDGYYSTVHAVGMDDKGNPQWNVGMSTTSYPRAMCEYGTGFHAGQNVVAWVNSTNGGLYGQNIGQLGEMGPITPPTPPAPCYAPTNFSGEYSYSEEMFGAQLSWEAPETTPLHYNLYIQGLKEVIEIDPQYTSWFQELEPGDYMFRLTAVYEDCESNFALTEAGEDYVFLTVTSVPENEAEEMVTVTRIYTMSGQLLHGVNPEELSKGVYIIQGLSSSGKLVSRKVMVD